MLPLFFADRSRKADDYPWLAWKVRLFTAGAVLAVFGMVQDDNRIIAVATVVLLAGFLLRFLPDGRGLVTEDEDEEDVEDERDEFDPASSSEDAGEDVRGS